MRDRCENIIFTVRDLCTGMDVERKDFFSVKDGQIRPSIEKSGDRIRVKNYETDSLVLLNYDLI